MSYKTMDVRPLGSVIGAEIYGIDLRDRDSNLMWEELRRAYLEFHVIAVRGQQLAPEDQMRIGAFFGEPCHYPFAKGMEGFPFMTRIVKEPEDKDNFGSDWHTDTMYLPQPPGTTLLYAVQTPPRGGDTLYTSTRAAYDALSEGMKAMLAGKLGVCSAGLKHKKGGDRAAHHSRIGNMPLQGAESADRLENKHPIVRTHPQTGRKALYCSALHTIRIDGMTESESRPIVEMLNDHAIEAEFGCRLRWEPGQLTIWDNRCTMHNAINDYNGHRREMRRLTVGAETPV